MQLHQTVDGSPAKDCRSTGGNANAAPPACAACGALEHIVVGDSVVTPASSNVCCARCGLLQVMLNPSLALPDAPPPEAVTATDTADSAPGDATARHRRAAHLSRAVNLKMADTVLALGTSDVALLAEFNELFGIEGYVVAAHRNQQLPEGCPFRFHTGPLLDFTPDVKFDHVFATGVLERQNDALKALLHLRKLLKPSGRLTLSTNNVLPGGEISESAFFGAGITLCLSPNTVAVLLARAGFLVDQMSATETLTVVAKPNPNVELLPQPFVPQMMTAPEQTGEWLVARLAAYVNLQQLRFAAQQGALRNEHLRHVLALLDVPAFEGHRVDCLVDIVQSLANQGAGANARLIATSAAMNQRLPQNVRDGFARFAAALT